MRPIRPLFAGDTLESHLRQRHIEAVRAAQNVHPSTLMAADVDDAVEDFYAAFSSPDVPLLDRGAITVSEAFIEPLADRRLALFGGEGPLRGDVPALQLFVPYVGDPQYFYFSDVTIDAPTPPVMVDEEYVRAICRLGFEIEVARMVCDRLEDQFMAYQARVDHANTRLRADLTAVLIRRRGENEKVIAEISSYKPAFPLHERGVC